MTQTQTNGRLPEGYEFKEQGASKYFKITEDSQAFRIVSDPVIGYIYFKDTVDGKVQAVRRQANWDTTPADSHNGYAPKEFWAFVVRNHNVKALQIFELSQRTLMKSIIELKNNPDWGDPRGYDISVSKTGQKKETKYVMTPLPKSRFETDTDLDDAIEDAKKIDLHALFEGRDPFNDIPF